MKETETIFQQVHDWLKTAGVVKNDSIETFNIIKEFILEELDELEIAVKNNDTDGQKDAIIDLIWMVLNWAYSKDLTQLEQFANRVNWSNWTKFCATEQEAIDTCNAYLQGKHPSKPGKKIECYISESTHNDQRIFIVKRLSDNKILKSINFLEP